MGDAAEPAPQPSAAVHGDRGGADRRRSSAMHRISQAELRAGGAGVELIPEAAGAAEEDSGEDFASTTGDTFTDMIMNLLQQLTGGDEVIDLNIYNLLRQAGLDEFRVNSLTAALQLEGEDALSAENESTLETMSISAMEAFQTACTHVNVALKETLEAATKYSRTQINDLILNNTADRGDDSLKLADTLREGENDKQFRAVYRALEVATFEINELEIMRNEMQKAREVLNANPETWGQMAGKSKVELKQLMDGEMADDQVHIDRIDKAIKGVEKSIADTISKHHSELVESLGVSTTGTDQKDAKFRPNLNHSLGSDYYRTTKIPR